MHGGNGLKFCMLMYTDHLQKLLDHSHGLLIFIILALFGISGMGQIWGFPFFLESAWREHSADSSVKLSGRQTTQTQTSGMT